MSNFFSALTGKKIAGEGYKSNVMASVNWVIGFSELLFGVGVIKGPSLWIQILSAVVFIGLLIFYCWMVRYFVVYDPSRLQSERYNLEIHAINALYKDTADDKSKLKIPSQNQPTIQKPTLP